MLADEANSQSVIAVWAHSALTDLQVVRGALDLALRTIDHRACPEVADVLDAAQDRVRALSHACAAAARTGDWAAPAPVVSDRH